MMFSIAVSKTVYCFRRISHDFHYFLAHIPYGKEKLHTHRRFVSENYHIANLYPN